jgi:hypothetical protein
MRIFLAAVLLGVISYAQTGIAATEIEIAGEPGTLRPVYQKRFETSAILAYIPAGTRVELFESIEGWAMIRMADSRVGYVKETASHASMAEGQYAVITCYLFFRDNSGKISTVDLRRTASVLDSLAEDPIARVACGDSVTLVQREALGAKVRTKEGLVGYVPLSSIRSTVETSQIDLRKLSSVERIKLRAELLARLEKGKVSSAQLARAQQALMQLDELDWREKEEAKAATSTQADSYLYSSPSTSSFPQPVPVPSEAPRGWSWLGALQGAMAGYAAGQAISNSIRVPTSSTPTIAPSAPLFAPMQNPAEEASGFNKICYYTCGLSKTAINIASTSICPLTIVHQNVPCFPVR